MNRPYTRAEIEELGKEFPGRGPFCPVCDNYLPVFEDVPPEVDAELRGLSRIESIRILREKTGCSLVWAKIWTMHPDGPHEEGARQLCPYCGASLHLNARQCGLCKMDWHDEEHPVRRGDSIADAILKADPESTITIRGRNALGSAIAYANINRPDANLKFVVNEITRNRYPLPSSDPNM